MQQPEMIEATRLSKFAGEIPNSKVMVKVESLLTKADHRRVGELHLGILVVKIREKVFFVSKQHDVPVEAEIQRDAQQNLLGIPTVVGG